MLFSLHFPEMRGISIKPQNIHKVCESPTYGVKVTKQALGFEHQCGPLPNLNRETQYLQGCLREKLYIRYEQQI